MSITQYSKIQHRRGLSQDIQKEEDVSPSGVVLNTSELGHVIDERRLFIGNGEITEGAPETGNTEIITDYTLLANREALKYAYKSNTPVEAITNTVRSISEALDDRLSVKSYGAMGDGVANDYSAIAQALKNVYVDGLPYVSEDQAQARRAIYFPAGKYSINDVLKLPPHSILVGDGIGRTIIEMSDASFAGGIIKTVDSLNQEDAQIGTNGATIPENIYIFGISFVHSGDNDIVHLDRANGVIFDYCSFEVSEDIALPTIAIGVVPNTFGSVYDVSGIMFNNCLFKNLTKAFDVDSVNVDNPDTRNIKFSKCTFEDLTNGVYINWESKDIKIENSLFKNVAGESIFASSACSYVVSSNNTFVACGNGVDSIVEFNDAVKCSSVGDMFTADCLGNRISVSLNNNLIVNSEGDQIFQNVKITSKKAGVTLPASVSVVDSGYNLIDDVTLENTKFIDYSLFGNGFSRIGRISVASDGTLGGTVMNDTFTESGATGVVFSFVLSGNTINLYYSNTSGISATLHVQEKSWMA